jgi:multisubunit Na+/H+ antiporter MnhE subunit
MKFLAFLAQLLLWLAVAASPTIVGLIIGFVLSMQAGDLYNLTVPLSGIAGFIIGGLWAERIRKTIGLPAFFGRLIGMRELRDGDKNS